MSGDEFELHPEIETEFFWEEGKFAYVPGEVITVSERGRDVMQGLFGVEPAEPDILGAGSGKVVFDLFRLYKSVDILDVIDELALEGVIAQPNHVLFSHNSCCCGPHPATTWQCPVNGSLGADPLHASFWSDPLHASSDQGPPHLSGCAQGRHRCGGYRSRWPCTVLELRIVGTCLRGRRGRREHFLHRRRGP
jgi:hypothetical protein